MAQAKERGLWVHMGRVNSYRRLRHARRIGCDSVDGGMFSRWSKTYLPLALAWLATEEPQGMLF